MATPKDIHREGREVTLPTQPTTECQVREVHSMLVCPQIHGYHSLVSHMGLLSSKPGCLVQALQPVRSLVTHTNKVDLECPI